MNLFDQFLTFLIWLGAVGFLAGIIPYSVSVLIRDFWTTKVMPFAFNLVVTFLAALFGLLCVRVAIEIATTYCPWRCS